MTIAGACVLPAAPVLVAGIGGVAPSELDETRARSQAVLQALAAHELLLVIAAADDAAAGLYHQADIDLVGLSLAQPSVPARVPSQLAQELSAATGLPLQAGPVPVDLAVLVLQAAACADTPPAVVLPVALPWRDGPTLRALVSQLLAALPNVAVAVVAAGDLSAGHGPKAPRPAVTEASDWDDALVAALADSDTAALDALGPDDAQRVVARGWPALVALHAALQPQGLAFQVRHRASPRGVGYLVGHA